MRILILTARPDVATNRRLVEAAREQVLDCTVVDATQVVSAVGSDRRPAVLRGGTDVLGGLPAAVIARVGNWRPETMLATLETCLDAGAATANLPSAIRRGRDHWQTARALSRAGVSIPATIAGMDPESTAAQAVDRLGLPVVVKVRSSRMGIGVMLCERRDHLENVCDSLWRLGDEFVVQEYVHCSNESVRAFVVGRQVVAAAKFVAEGNEWRSNGARGGGAIPTELSVDDRALALRAAKATALGICGVDLLHGSQGTVVCEVNPTPGFIRLEAACGVDVAGAIIRWVSRL